MAEWLKAAVLKTVRAQALVGSNPTPSAINSLSSNGRPFLGRPSSCPRRDTRGLDFLDGPGRHGYANVSDEVVWGVVEGSLPKLTRYNSRMAERLGAGVSFKKLSIGRHPNLQLADWWTYNRPQWPTLPDSIPASSGNVSLKP